MLPELKKLGVTGGQRILVRRAPKSFTDELRTTAPPDVLVSTRPAARGKYDLIFHFPQPDENFDALFGELERALQPDGALWVVIPNQKAAKRMGVRYDWKAMLASALQTRLVDNKTLTFSPDEYGTRFVIRKELRAKR